MKKTTDANKAKKRKVSKFPRGWNQKRVQAVIDYYDKLTEDEELAEYEAGMEINGQSMIMVPRKLIPEIEALIARRSNSR